MESGAKKMGAGAERDTKVATSEGPLDQHPKTGPADGLSHPSVRDLLAKTPLFGELGTDELDLLAQGARTVRVGHGDVIFRQGEPCAGFHVIVHGQVKLVHASAAGTERVMRLIGAGDSFGEAFMFLERDYVITAEALCDTLLLYVQREALFKKLDGHPQLARKMLVSLSHRLYMLMGDVGAYTTRSGSQRLIGYLFRAAQGCEGVPFRVEMTKGVIASRLNLTPEHFSRILRELSERKLIRVKGREFTILDPEGLRAFSD
ncbi:MAG: Crp/Fnr family transcriptional regulator [Comamonas sp.]|jgi:CRP-like cAMP-binding protein